MKKKVTIECGFSCGRHWIRINNVMIAQTLGDDVWMKDEDVCDLARAIVPGCDWKKAFRLEGPGFENRHPGVVLQSDTEKKRQALREAGYENTWHHDVWVHPNERKYKGFDEFRSSRSTDEAYRGMIDSQRIKDSLNEHC